MNLYPIQDVLKQADEAMAIPGTDIYQQFNCAGCGIKQTMEKANTIYASGKCEECGHITNIEKDGCNLMIVSNLKGKP